MISAALAWNLLLRGAALLALLQIAMLVLQGHRHAAAKLCAGFALGTAAFVLDTLPAPAMSALPLHAVLGALDAGNIAVFWLFTRSLLDDEFKLRPWHGLGWAVLAATGALRCLQAIPFHDWHLGLVLDLATAGFALLAIAQSLATWRADLVEGRRRFRIWLLASSAAYAILVAATSLGDHSLLAGTANALGLAVLSAIALAQLTREDLLAPDAPAPEEETPEPETPPEPATPAKPDPALLAKLRELMEQQGLYREENLTIGALAELMGLPEHKLRKLINQGLGYRNFNVFLNSYRLAEARQALCDPARSGDPVLAIAMEAGFQSLGPFNRAFKADTGMTPSEYRRNAGQVPA